MTNERLFWKPKQLNRFFPVCILVCNFREAKKEKTLNKKCTIIGFIYNVNYYMCPQIPWISTRLAVMRTQGFSPVWTTECSLSCNSEVKDFSHNKHINGFSLVWILMCLLRYFESVKHFLHTEHINSISPVWLLECFLRSEE
jgi:hypothetical protein